MKTKHLKNFASEDKEKTNFRLNDQKPVYPRTKRKEDPKTEILTNFSPSNMKRIKSNKYYNYLRDKYKKNPKSLFLSDRLKSVFSKWTHKEYAEFYNFNTEISYYKIIKLIGKGCFGKVYLAVQILT